MTSSGWLGDITARIILLFSSPVWGPNEGQAHRWAPSALRCCNNASSAAVKGSQLPCITRAASSSWSVLVKLVLTVLLDLPCILTAVSNQPWDLVLMERWCAINILRPVLAGLNRMTSGKLHPLPPVMNLILFPYESIFMWTHAFLPTKLCEHSIYKIWCVCCYRHLGLFFMPVCVKHTYTVCMLQCHWKLYVRNQLRESFTKEKL